MFEKEFQYIWKWNLDVSPESLWPYISDTNRFNHDSKLPEVSYVPGKESQLLLGRKLRFSILGTKIEYEELPFEWVRPSYFSIIRLYKNGPIRELHVRVELHERISHGTTVHYGVRVVTSSLIGTLIVPVSLGILNARKFERVFRNYDKLAQKNDPDIAYSSTVAPKVRFASNGRERIRSICTDLHEHTDSDNVVDKIADFMMTADEMAVLHIRPYVLADQWKIARKSVLEHFLYATRAGLVDFQWDLMCPSCRGAKDGSKHLKDMKSQVHCDSCNIDFTTQFDKSVELTFRPNPSIRKLNEVEFCVGGPQVTPHILAQQQLKPAETRTIQPNLVHGIHRIRTFDESLNVTFEVADTGAKELTVGFVKREEGSDTLQICTDPIIHLNNTSDKQHLYILEHAQWMDDAVTASDVISLQLFRDLFSDEALRPGDQVSVGTVTILFTDLRGSTKMYRAIGDAPAFGKVMNHFDVLRKEINDENGAIVKTIGDAIMGVFTNPAACLRAIMNAQKEFAKDGVDAICLKAGIHSGPCIAVTLNNRLDYFGTTVNLASRLEGFSNGSDIIVSNSVYEDLEVKKIISQYSLSVDSLNTEIKGFDEEQFRLWRLNTIKQ